MGTTFSLWDEAVEAVYANKVNDDEARRIRSEVYQLHPRMKLYAKHRIWLCCRLVTLLGLMKIQKPMLPYVGLL